MADTSTLHDLMPRLVRELWPGRYPLVVPVSSLHANSNATSLLISSAAYSSGDTNAYDGVTVYMPCANSSVTAPEGEYGGRVTRGGYTVATGAFALSPGFSDDPNTAPTNTPNVLFLYGLHPNEILEAINNVQRNLYLPRYLVPTLVTDGDFEASGVTNWTDAVGTPTQTKETSIVLVGTQSLKIVTTVSGHAVQGASIPVTEGEQMLYSTPIKCTAGSIVASIQDVTNSTTIDSVTVDQEAWTEALFQFTVPSGCKNVAPRYASATASTTAYVGWSSLLSQDRRIIDLPSQIEDAQFIEGIYHLPSGRSSEASNSYLALAERFIPHETGQPWRDWRAVNAQRLEIGTLRSYPLFIRYRGRGTTFASIAATTSSVTEAPEELVVQGALADLCGRLFDKTEDGYWKRRQQEHHALYSRMLDEYDLLRPQVTSGVQYRVRV